MNAKKCANPRCSGIVDLGRSGAVRAYVFESKSVAAPLHPCSVCDVLHWPDGHAFVSAMGMHAFWRNGEAVLERIAA